MIRITRTLAAAAAALILLVVVFAGCSAPSSQETSTPGTFKTTASAGATAVVSIDTSGSVATNTDLLSAAQNKVLELVGRMPVGGRVIIRGFNSNVTAACTDVVYTLPSQKNPDVLTRARQANQADVPARFAALIDCSVKNDHHATELFGGLAETFRTYPDAEILEAYTDGCDNVNVDVCDASRLHRPGYPKKVLNELPPALTPALSASVDITFHGVGRGTQLDAAAVQGLRDVLSAWAAKTGATSSFLDH